MKDSTVNMTKSKRAILVLVILNILFFLGLAVLEFVYGITSEYVPPSEPGFFTIDPRPLLFIFAGMFAILALIELYLGILTYKGNRGAAIVLLVTCVCFGGYLGAAAAIVALVAPRKQQDNPD